MSVQPDSGGLQHRMADRPVSVPGCVSVPGGGAVLGPAVHDFLNTRCLSIAGGTEQILLTLAAERLLGLPRG